MSGDINNEIKLSEVIPDPSVPFLYAQHCHEATLTFAYALNKTITGQPSLVYLMNSTTNYIELETNMELNRDAAMMAGLPDETKFKMENFHYNNLVIVEEMFRHLRNTSFSGLSVSWKLLSTLVHVITTTIDPMCTITGLSKC